MRIFWAIGLALFVMSGTAYGDTLAVVAKDGRVPPIVNAFPIDPATGAMWVENLTPARCQDLLAQMQNDPLAGGASCIPAPVDPTKWSGQ